MILGLDGDVRHLMIATVVKEADDFEDDTSDEVNDELMSTSSKQVLVLAKVDVFPETRHNVELMLNMNFQYIGDDFQVVCDLKMLNILLGIQSSTSLFGCPFCEAS